MAWKRGAARSDARFAPAVNPEALVLNRIDIPSAAGRRIPALQAGHGPHAALLVHGITAEKAEGGLYLRLAERLLTQGVGVLSMDLPGHGDSAIAFEDASVSQMVEDLVHAHRFLADRHAAVTLVCMSFAASVYLLASAAGLPRCDSVVLLNPVTDYRANFVEADTDWGRAFCPQLAQPGFWTVPHHALPGDTRRLGRRLISELALLSPQSVRPPAAQRLWVLHGTADSVISLASARVFVAGRAPHARFIEVPGAEHGFHTVPGAVLAAVDEAVSGATGEAENTPGAGAETDPTQPGRPA